MTYLIDCGELLRVSAAAEADALALAELASSRPAQDIAARTFCACGAAIAAGRETACAWCGEIHCPGCCLS